MCDHRTNGEQIEDLRDAEALAILAATVLGFSANGEIPVHLKTERPAVLWALGQAQYRHAWVVCGPIDDAMGRLITKRGG